MTEHVVVVMSHAHDLRHEVIFATAVVAVFVMVGSVLGATVGVIEWFARGNYGNGEQGLRVPGTQQGLHPVRRQGHGAVPGLPAVQRHRSHRWDLRGLQGLGLARAGPTRAAAVVQLLACGDHVVDV